jgi:anti-sigma regulatory factor (Ser/Thr protein kinase)
MPDARASRHIDLTEPGGRMDRLLGELQAFSAAHDLPEQVAQDVHLALDEIVSNVVLHGGRADRVCHISVDLALHGTEIEVLVKDDAEPFDPLQKPDPDPALPLTDRPIGGLGIYLVKQLMTDVRYRREGGFNHLTMTKRWDATATGL